MVAAAFASTSTAAAAAYSSSLPPNPTARDPVRRRTPPLVTATNRHRHVHGRTATSLRQARPRDRFLNPPRPQFPAAAAAEAGEMAAEASTGAKPFAVLFVCLGKSREPP
jgi:protein-tyrosine phosphatase